VIDPTSGAAGEDALEVLEFREALEGVAGRAGSELGRQAVLGLRPSGDPGLVELALDRVGELLVFLEDTREFQPPDVPDARMSLERLGIEGGVLDPIHLHVLGRLLGEARRLHGSLDRVGSDLPHLREMRSALYLDAPGEDRIGRTVDAGGEVLDSASPDLKKIRSRLRSAQSRIVRSLESYLKTVPERFRVMDGSVTVRDGRYVVPIRREGKGVVGGVVHDESGTGATLFIEPPVALQLMGELKELERSEHREVQRVLRELSDALRPVVDALAGDLEILIAFDSLYARARMAREWEGSRPHLFADGEVSLRIVGGRHPLLVLQGEERVVPFDLEMDPSERVLVVSGPNTGGKSVLLKSVGLLTLLTQSGIIPPVGPETRLPVVQRVFTDIGDAQSISASLSTFSAHLARLRTLLEEAGPGSLVLIDEMGTGTDPAEGAALARAILETLVARGALAVVTSHLGSLKTLDQPGSGIVNASLQFDGERMEPTYHLVKGRPGRSYGLAIARRMGLPSEVVDRAESFLSEEEAGLEDVLERLEARDAEAVELTALLEKERDHVVRLREELADREERMSRKEDSAEARAHEEARRLLMDARREVEEAIREVRSADGGEVDEASARARSRVERAAREHRKKAARPDRPAVVAGDVGVGDRVAVMGSGAKGEVLELREGKATVAAGLMRIQVPVGELSLVAKAGASGEEAGREGAVGPTPRGGIGGWSGEDMAPSPEVDLRGMRADEAALAVARAVDAAIFGGLNELRIIHGKGTGALRVMVDQAMKSDSRIQAHRLGGIGEGGAGVTVATFR
jgi:DNA mismatch repair protein MutS2